jgi:hypothetical protein
VTLWRPCDYLQIGSWPIGWRDGFGIFEHTHNISFPIYEHQQQPSDVFLNTLKIDTAGASLPYYPGFSMLVDLHSARLQGWHIQV